MHLLNAILTSWLLVTAASATITPRPFFSARDAPTETVIEPGYYCADGPPKTTPTTQQIRAHTRDGSVMVHTTFPALCQGSYDKGEVSAARAGLSSVESVLYDAGAASDVVAGASSMASSYNMVLRETTYAKSNDGSVTETLTSGTATSAASVTATPESSASPSVTCAAVQAVLQDDDSTRGCLEKAAKRGGCDPADWKCQSGGSRYREKVWSQCTKDCYFKLEDEKEGERESSIWDRCQRI